MFDFLSEADVPVESEFTWEKQMISLLLIPWAQIQTEHKSPKMNLKQNVNTHKSRAVKTSAELQWSVPSFIFFPYFRKKVINYSESLPEHALNFLICFFFSNHKHFGTTPILKSSGDTETNHSFPSKENWHLQSISQMYSSPPQHPLTEADWFQAQLKK